VTLWRAGDGISRRGLERDAQAGVVANVLAQRRRAIEVHARQRLVPGVLHHHAGDQHLEARHILVLPPGAQDAIAIRLGTLVVERVAHLVSDHAADPPTRCDRSAR
jgi:hypothetical protein